MGHRLLTVPCALIIAGCGSNAVIVPRSSASPAALRWTADPVKHTATPAPTATPTAAPPTARVTVTRSPTQRPRSAPGPITLRTGWGPTIGGCAVFPSSNAWNQDISTAPVDPNSTAYVARIDSSRQFLHPDFGSDPSYGIPYIVVPGNQPMVPITFTAYGSESDPGPYPVPLNAPVEVGSDAHVLVVDSGNCHLYEMYSAHQRGNGWDAASGAVFNLGSNALRPDGWTSADAAGLPILPGLVRYDEVAAGVISHALRFTVNETQNGFIHPATHQAGVANATDPPMGARFRLKASFDLTPFQGEALVILTALKRYGMIVADNGSSWFVSGATDSRWLDNDLNQLKGVPGSAFEAVATGPIQRG
ncbi:hypothetical protein [Candidatus Aeolococcus gillhamiae]|uniref:hypothetical protein n=1 Tax=Candidatus Aeolococcus gillhamiae TaxID=3127015 RepID=UPI0030771FAE